MSSLHANLLLLCAALFWGAGNVAQKSILESLGPLTTVGARCLLGALVILPLVLRENAASHGSLRPVWPRIVLGASLFALAIVLQQFAFGATTVTNGSFLITTTIVFTPVAAWILWREPISTVLWPAMCLGLLGVYLLGGASFTDLGWGDVCALVSAGFYSVWIAYLGQLVARTGRPTAVTLAQFMLAGLVCAAIGAASEPFSVASVGGAIPELLVLGVLSTGLAYVFQALAQRHTPAGVAAVVMSAECVFGALGASLILGERLTLTGTLGASLILLAVLLVQFGAASAPRKHAPPTGAGSISAVPARVRRA